MKLRTVTAPPDFGAATNIIFGTDFSVTSPRFVRGPARNRIASIRAFKVASFVERITILIARSADILGPEHDARHAIVDRRAGRPLDLRSGDRPDRLLIAIS